MKRIFATDDNIAATVIRMMLGLVIFPHGAQKLLGWFGGYGFSGSMQFFTGTVHMPWILGFLVIMIEFFGSLMLILGLATRINAALMFVIFTGIILTTHIHNGFFMNWFNNQKGEGMEFSLLVLGMSAALVIAGGGKAAADRLLTAKA